MKQSDWLCQHKMPTCQSGTNTVKIAKLMQNQKYFIMSICYNGFSAF